MKQSVRRLSLHSEPWREAMLRAILAGLAEGIGAACLIVGVCAAVWGWQ